MKRNKKIIPPSFKDERELLAILESEDDTIKIRKRSFSFGFLTGHAQHKITKILLKEGNDLKNSCQCLAAARLNGFFSIKLSYWLLWRWYYYIRQYNEEELTEAIAMIKKKVPVKSYFLNTTLLIGMRETMMAMNKNEVYLTLREKSGDKDGNSAKKDSGSQNL